MLAKDIRPGIKVRAIKKSTYPFTFAEFVNRLPKGIGVVTKYNAQRKSVYIDAWHFSIEDVILAEGEAIKFSELYNGLKVRVINNSINIDYLLSFVQKYPSAIGTVHSINTNGGKVTFNVNDFPFELQDVVKVESGTKGETHSNTIISLKEITIEALLKEGACEDQLQIFIEIVTKKSLLYAFSPIPAAYAQDVATSLDHSRWLEQHGFIKTINLPIKQLTFIDHVDYIDVGTVKDESRTWFLFRVYKDGRGFFRYPNISDKNIATDKQEKIIELDRIDMW